MESTRAALIAAGQLEQALSDSTNVPQASSLFCDRPLTPHRNRLKPCVTPTGQSLGEPVTDAAAEALVACWQGRPTDHIRHLMERGLAALIPIVPSEFGVEPVLVKAPEGFAFYALFPEQYADAALAWASARSRSENRVLVVGIRSIGTTLSAVVKATLASIGWEVRRLTVRPCGGMYDRTVSLPNGAQPPVDWALIADEGPGNTGTSMAAAVFALEQNGVPRNRIGLLPSHAGNPGRESPNAVKACWFSVPKFIGQPPDIAKILATASEHLRGAAVVETSDLSAGAWRELVFKSRPAFPPVCALLERMKFRCALSDGSALFWKFAGFSGVYSQNADTEAERLRASYPWTPEPVAICDGFIATRWHEGARMLRATPDFASHLGRYLASSCGEELNEDEVSAAHARITPLLETNLTQWLGPEFAQKAKELWLRALPVPSPLCTDPRQLLHDWVETQRGQWIKTDSTGHLCDHTIPGRQPIEWGLAAACNACGPRESAPLLAAFQSESGRSISPKRLVAYQIANAAFRLGEFDLALTTGWPDNFEEQRRIEHGIRRIQRQVKRLLR